MPARLHFCWIGPDLPWAYAFAVLSAAAQGGMGEVVLHHTQPPVGRAMAALMDAPGVRLSLLDPLVYLAEVDGLLGSNGGLVGLYRRLAAPVMQADVLRAAILYREGGIYLDLDTVTVRALAPLGDTGAFVGSEFIVRPLHVRQSRSPWCWARATVLDGARIGLRQVPFGWRVFPALARFYHLSLNNAVMGAKAGSAFFAAYLRGMLALPAARQCACYGLGPHLLQDVAAHADEGELTVLAPCVFYPLPPEISEHWFRRRRRVRLGEVLGAETLVVHWYASVRSARLVGEITPGYVKAHRERQMYSALVWSCLGAARVEALALNESAA